MNDNMIPNVAGSVFTADMIAAGAPAPARYLFAAGKIVPTPDGTQATSIEFLGRKQNMPSAAVVELDDAPDFDQTVADHFEWCDDCDSSKDAYHHELDARNEPTC